MHKKRKVARRRELEDRKRPAKGRRRDIGRNTEAVKKEENRLMHKL
jgi:hypothetical protein